MIRTLVFCFNREDAYKSFCHMKENYEFTHSNKSRLELETKEQKFIFININSGALDGLRANSYLISEKLSKFGSQKNIQLANYLGGNATLIY